MIEKETLTFLSNLKANNNRDWFTEHKKDYQRAKDNFLAVTEKLIHGLSAFDEDIAGSNLDPKKCVLRINRDIRFSKDKSPYKTNFFCFINKQGKKSPFGGYYLSIDPEESFQGGGIYMPEAPILYRIRQEIDYQFSEWSDLVTSTQLVRHYGEVKTHDKLVRPPRGYNAENPAIEWIKYKGYYTQKMLGKKEILSDSFVRDTMKAFKALKPLVDFINRSIE